MPTVKTRVSDNTQRLALLLLICWPVTNILSFSDTELRKVNKIKTIFKALIHRKHYAHICMSKAYVILVIIIRSIHICFTMKCE